ncbi:nicotinate (nicotinamide) nucleotide adenylyltransferase [Xylanibacter brevis]|uniref:nicotinate (nicotinamide) nucleotide adenylyltransferase n=1 Tax=Xylanibacter brevis TaxID=83231 RepID=UPI0005C66949|nr:nicotinate (nicotinamide) nucleotide adenylyltransferase [Xylanibacter brevis]
MESESHTYPQGAPLLGRGRGRSIGLFGGSFNPIHIGHISLAKQLKQLAELDEIWFMVSPQNPLKESSDLLDEKLRFEMTEVALLGEEGLKACDYEFHMPRPSYTWNTLQQLSKDFPEHTFILLIGGDNWQNFHRWYRADDILNNHRIVVYPRRGCEIDTASLPANVSVANTELLDISSTEIRGRVKRNESLETCVPKVIEPLVRKLYR